MFEAGSCTLVSEAVLKQSSINPHRLAFATRPPGKTAPRARGRRRRESSPLPMRGCKQIQCRRGQRSVRSRRKRRRAVTWSSSPPGFYPGVGSLHKIGLACLRGPVEEVPDLRDSRLQDLPVPIVDDPTCLEEQVPEQILAVSWVVSPSPY